MKNGFVQKLAFKVTHSKKERKKRLFILPAKTVHAAMSSSHHPTLLISLQIYCTVCLTSF